MFNFKCGSCQQEIPDDACKLLIINRHILCPSCKTRLVFNGVAKLIVYMLQAILVVMLIYLSWNWEGKEISILFGWIAVIGLTIGKYIDNFFIYVISQLLSLQLVVGHIDVSSPDEI